MESTSGMKAMVKAYFCAFTLFLFLPPLSFSQVLDINVQSVDSLSVSDPATIVYDINGEICNLVIVRTELDSLKFYSNRGTEKIERKSGDYYIWISRESTVLKISVPELPLYDLKLPRTELKNSVILVFLSSQKTENELYVDTMRYQTFVSFVSTPTNADVYIDNKLNGYTPWIYNDVSAGQVLNYKIKKLRYGPVSGTDTIIRGPNYINVKLEDITKTKRFFLAATAGGIMTGNENLYRGFVPYYPGLSIGSIGRTGWFMSLKYFHSNSVATWGDWGWRIESGETYPTSVGKFGISAGVTQQLNHSFFFFAGAGYSSEKYKWVYNSVFKDYETTKFYDYDAFNISAGLMIRVFWNVIIYSDIVADFGSGYLNSYISAGAGFNATMKNKSNNKTKP